VTRLSPYPTQGLVNVPQVIERLSQSVALSPDDRIVLEPGWNRAGASTSTICGGTGETAFSGHAGRCRRRAMPDDVREAGTGVPVIDRSVRTF
jgi:hypothetical protein